MSTPYSDRFRFALAAQDHLTQQKLLDKEKMSAWKAYRRASQANNKTDPAILHKRGEQWKSLSALYAHRNRLTDQVLKDSGKMYNPQKHTMTGNNAWLLGLAHAQVPVEQVAPLTRTSVVRDTQKKLPSEEQDTSALAREMIALTQKGHYRAEQYENGTVSYEPQPSGRKAKIEDFATKKKYSEEELGEQLGKSGLRMTKEDPDFFRIYLKLLSASKDYKGKAWGELDEEAEKKEELPPDWKQYVDEESGRAYFLNPTTNTTTYKHPKLSTDWEVHQSEGNNYYYNPTTQETTWERPAKPSDLVEDEELSWQSSGKWKVYETDDGHKWYHNSETGDSTWDTPKEMQTKKSEEL